MKKRNVLVIGLVILCLGAALVFNRCSGENMTRVTINFGSKQQAALNSKDSFLEKLKRFFLPEALAFFPDPWYPDHTNIVITVSALDLDEPIEVSVSPNTESYTMEVPSGIQRRFTVIAYDGIQRNTGGHAIVDLPYSQVTVQIRMLPIPTNVGAYGGLTWDQVTGVTKYYIYESIESGGPFVKIGETNDDFPEWFGTLTTDRYYAVSVYYNDDRGEGELSDPWLNNL